MANLFVSALLLALLQLALSQTPSVVIHTRNGGVRGTVEEISGSTFTSFKGIRFAKPPGGSLRFRPPQPNGNWHGVLDATTFAPICPQTLTSYVPAVTVNGTDMRDEDCLHLNIYVSGDVAQNRSELLPVMLYIHSGGLTIGTARSYPGDLLVTQAEPIILVTIQYRLGIFGFFSSGDSEIPGNAGFLDQVLALQWVQDNIEAFGGDKSRVAIFGESAGAQSILQHLVSPLSAGLFRRQVKHFQLQLRLL